MCSYCYLYKFHYIQSVIGLKVIGTSCSYALVFVWYIVLPYMYVYMHVHRYVCMQVCMYVNYVIVYADVYTYWYFRFIIWYSQLHCISTVNSQLYHACIQADLICLIHSYMHLKQKDCMKIILSMHSMYATYVFEKC